MAADANSVDETMNSPEIKPIRPMINSIPIKISLYKLLMGKSSYEVERFYLNHDSTIWATYLFDNGAINTWIVSLLVAINS